MEEYVKHILEKKAAEVSEYLTSKGFSFSYGLIDYGINFKLQYGGSIHTLTLWYKASKRRWTAQSPNEWVKDVVIPLIQPFLGGTPPSISKQKANIGSNEQQVSSAEVYFAEARECLRMLEPFARENIDFSVICDFAQRGVQLALNDPRCPPLDRQALEKVLVQPHQSDFQAAKEYLQKCLTLCKTTES